MQVETLVTVSRHTRLPAADSAGDADCRGESCSLIAAYCSLLQFLGTFPPLSRGARRNRQGNLERADGAIAPANGLLVVAQCGRSEPRFAECQCAGIG